MDYENNECTVGSTMVLPAKSDNYSNNMYSSGIPFTNNMQSSMQFTNLGNYSNNSGSNNYSNNSGSNNYSNNSESNNYSNSSFISIPMLDLQKSDNNNMPAPAPRHSRRNSSVSKPQLRQNNLNMIADLPNINNYDQYYKVHHEFEYSLTNANVGITSQNPFNLSDNDLSNLKNLNFLVKFEYKLISDDSYYLSLLMKLDSYSEYDNKKKVCNAYIDLNLNTGSVGLLFTERIKNHTVFNKYKYIYAYDGVLYTDEVFDKILSESVLIKDKFSVYAYLDITSAIIIPIPKHADIKNILSIKSEQKDDLKRYLNSYLHDFDLCKKLTNELSEFFNLSAYVDSEKIRIKHTHNYCTFISTKKASSQADLGKILSYSIPNE